MKIEYTLFSDTQGRIIYTKNDDKDSDRNYFTFSRCGDMVHMSEERLTDLVIATLDLSKKLREALEQALSTKKDKDV